MSRYTKQDIFNMVEEEDVEFIRLQFTDMFGTLKNVAITSSQLEKALNNECMFDGSSIEGFVRIEESDMYLYPDLDTFVIFPWRPQQGKVARIICDVYTSDRKPFEGDPRYILKKAVEDADLVIESLSEDPKAKIEFYENMAPLLPEKTVIVTNSSTMLPSTFAKYTGRPEKYLALHFANEIWKNNTAEIMGHSETDPKYYNEVVEFAQQIGMIPLKLKKEQPGYILNSLLVPFLNAGQALLANDVADPETIDLTWVLGTGAPAGPFRILDIVGLDTAYNIVIMNPEAKDPNTIPGKIAKILKEYIDAGKKGVATGEGFYKYK